MHKSETPSYLGEPPTWKGSTEIGARLSGLPEKPCLCASATLESRRRREAFPVKLNGLWKKKPGKGSRSWLG